MEWMDDLAPWLELLIRMAFDAVLGLVVSFLLLRAWRWHLKRRNEVLVPSLQQNIRRPLYFFFPLLAMVFGYSSLQETTDLPDWGYYAILSVFYIVCGWLSLAGFRFFADTIRNRYDISDSDNLDERKVITQLDYLEDVIRVVVFILFFALILLQFDSVQRFGTSILASAGVAGIIIGVAAQNTIANLLAGFQIAFTQPIRIDDVVIAEGEWGRIEEITLTYVVVKIWDERRLVLPIRYFIDKPFQNWTRTTSQILGTVFLHMDYTVPVEVLRQKLRELLEAHPLWDQRVSVVQVTDSKPNAIEVRLLMSARNSPDAWDLRCDIREQMITFIQQEYPDALPSQRIRLEGVQKEYGAEPS